MPALASSKRANLLEMQIRLITVLPMPCCKETTELLWQLLSVGDGAKHITIDIRDSLVCLKLMLAKDGAQACSLHTCAKC